MPGDRRPRTPTRRALAAVVVGLAVAGCAEELPEIETADARAELDRLVDEHGSGTRMIGDCPIADGDALLRQAFSIVADDRVEEALDDEPYTRLAPRATAATLVCGRGTDFGVGLALGTGAISIDRHLAALSESGLDARTDVTERLDHRGGRVARICRLHEDEPSLDVCEVVWLVDDISVSAFVGGAGAGEIALKDLEERFVPVVQLVVDGLAAPDL